MMSAVWQQNRNETPTLRGYCDSLERQRDEPEKREAKRCGNKRGLDPSESDSVPREAW